MYYVRRDGRIKGPLTPEKLRSLRQERRLRMRDEVSESADGPWQRLRDVRDRVLGNDDETPRFDSGIWSEDPVPMLLADEDGVVGGEPDPEWHESLQTWLEGEDPFRKPFRPWMYALGSMLLVALAILAIAIVFGTH
jgi:hypothetical protein